MVLRTLLCTLVYGIMENPSMQRTYFCDAALTLAVGERDLHPGSIERTRSRAHADTEETHQRMTVPARSVRPRNRVRHYVYARLRPGKP